MNMSGACNDYGNGKQMSGGEGNPGKKCETDVQVSAVDGTIKDINDFIANSFEDMNLREELLQVINARAFSSPVPLQQLSILPLTKGYDAVIEIRPRMGKKTTVAIAILQNTDPVLQACQALVLSPTERDAEQMQQVIADMGHTMKVECHSCITGNSLKEDVRKLKGGVRVVVGNLERIHDLIYRRALRTHEIKILVIEDAGEMLSGMFREEIYDIIKTLKADVQLLLLSSSMKDDIFFEFENILHYPAFSVINNELRILKNQKHFYIPVLGEHLKIEILFSLYEKLSIEQCVIFCGTMQKVDVIKKHLEGREFAASAFHHGMCQKERDVAMKEFCSGNIPTLITNDVLMACNVQKVSLIISYDFPNQKENYIPEIRRRDHFQRIAISFVTEDEKQMLKEIGHFYKIKIEELLTFDTDLYSVLSPHTGARRKDSRKCVNLQSYDDYVAVSFGEMNLCRELQQGIFECGFEKPKPLQQKAILPCVNGYDVIICANRRSGKTTTLAIATLQNVDTRLQHCQALVLSSTRHSAKHMLDVLNNLGDYMNVQCRVFIGGIPIREDVPKLEKCIHVVVGTAGRIEDLITRRYLRTSHVKMLILEEVSDLFSKQQRDQTRHIFQALNSDIQILLSSASVPDDAMEQLKKMLREPICIVTPKLQMNLKEIKQFYLPFIRENLIFETLSNLYIKLTVPQSVIFCNRKRKSDFQHNKMPTEDLTVSALLRYIDSRKTDIIMKNFCSVSDHVLISTGFLKQECEPLVSVIINYDFLIKKENYLRSINKDDSYFHKDVIVDIVPETKELDMKELKHFLFRTRNAVSHLSRSKRDGIANKLPTA